MASLNSLMDRFKNVTDITVWELAAKAMEQQDAQVVSLTSAKKGKKKAGDDIILIPELFICGYLDIMSELEECNWTGSQEKIRQRYMRVAENVGTRRHKKLLNDLSREHRISFEDDLFNASEYYDLYLQKRLARGNNSLFEDELAQLFEKGNEPAGNEQAEYSAGMIGAGEVLDFCVNFLNKKGKPVTKTKTEQEMQDIPLGSLSKKYMDLRMKLSQEVISQDNAIRKFVQGLFMGELSNREKRSGPESSYLFVGPPGVGKTFLAKTVAKLLGRPSKIFQMSEYAHSSDFHDLVGHQKTWSNAQRGALTTYVEANENAILLFDEIEKAHRNTIHLFLSILEGGTLEDLYTQEEVDFTGTIVIFTTNAGRKFYEEKRDASISTMSEETLIDALRSPKYNEEESAIPGEILSRMAKGNIIGFDHMNPAKLIPIIRKGMRKGVEAVKESLDIQCEFDEDIFPYIFLFHMGSKLDARVALARSEGFVKNMMFNLSEHIWGDGEQKTKSAANADITRARFTVAEGEPLETELTLPSRKSEILVVCNQEDYNRFLKPENDNNYQMKIVYAEQEERNFQDYISETLQSEQIDAIFVDPYMRELNGDKSDNTAKTGRKTKGRKKTVQKEIIEDKQTGAMEGLAHKDTMGMRVLDWLSKQEGLPPIYCLELNEERPINFTDEQELQNKGIRDVLRLSKTESREEKREIIENLTFSLFLSSKMNSLISKGKTVEYDVGFITQDNTASSEVEIRINNLRYAQSMDPEAQEIFISDELRKEGGFDSVIGQEAAKEELRYFLKFIQDPGKYRKSGQQISKGILFYGPPGTGKTKLARSFACEADCPFISVTGSQFLNGYKKIPEVFALARKYAPSVVFIDEIESIAKVAGNPIVKELLTEMDGFSGREKPVFVIAATNAGDAPDLDGQNIYLDPALLRRFTKKVYMKIPERKDRIEWLKNRQRAQKNLEYNLESLSENDILEFADLTAGYSLADLENVIAIAINRAAETDTPVTLSLLTACFEETVYGEEHAYDPEHIRITAYHESGHAFMGFYHNNGKNNRFIPEYATIIARGGYLGAVHQKNDETLSGYTREELLKMIDISLAGRAVEIVLAEKNGNADGGLSTGASNDLEKSTLIASNILSRYGMEEGYMASVPFNMIMNSPLAEKYLGKINEILSQEMERTLNIIRENFEKIQLLAQALLERSRLDTKEMKSIISIPESASEKAGTKTESVKNKTKAGKRSKKREQDSDALL